MEQYYAENYFKCNLDTDFLSSWQLVAYSTHAIQVLSLPFQILTFYAIIFKTPVVMNGVKMSLIVNHACCALFDIFVCTFSTAYIFVPLNSILFVGLLSWFKVDIRIQSLPIAFSMTCKLWFIFNSFLNYVSVTVLSYVYLFESRSSALAQNRFRIKTRTGRVLYYSILSLPFLLSSYFSRFIPENQEEAKLSALMHYPCPTREFFNQDVFIVLSDENVVRILIWVLSFIALYVVAIGFFHVMSLIYYLYIAPGKLTSKSTQQRQKVFLYCISIQAALPSVFCVIPLVLVFISFLAGHYSQKVMNIVVCSVGLHGFAESLVVIIVHKPYRNAVGEMIAKIMSKSFIDNLLSK